MTEQPTATFSKVIFHTHRPADFPVGEWRIFTCKRPIVTTGKRTSWRADSGDYYAALGAGNTFGIDALYQEHLRNQTLYVDGAPIREVIYGDDPQAAQYPAANATLTSEEELAFEAAFADCLNYIDLARQTLARLDALLDDQFHLPFQAASPALARDIRHLWQRLDALANEADEIAHHYTPNEEV